MLYSFNNVVLYVYYYGVVWHVYYCYCYHYYYHCVLGEMIEDRKCEMLVCSSSVYLFSVTEYLHLGSIKDDQPAKEMGKYTPLCIQHTNTCAHTNFSMKEQRIFNEIQNIFPCRLWHVSHKPHTHAHTHKQCTKVIKGKCVIRNNNNNRMGIERSVV